MDDAINLSEFDFENEDLVEEKGTAFPSTLKPSLAQALFYALAAMASGVSETERRIIQKFTRDAALTLGIDRNMLRRPKRLAAILRRQTEGEASALSNVSEIFDDPTDRQIMNFCMAYEGVGAAYGNPLEVAVDTIQRDLGLRCCLFDCPRCFYLFAGIPEKKFLERMATHMPLQRSGLLSVEPSGQIFLHHKVKSFLNTGATGDPWAFLAADKRANCFQEIPSEEFFEAVEGLEPLLPALQRGQHVRLALQHGQQEKELTEDLLRNLARCVGAQLYWVAPTEITLATQIVARRSKKAILGVIPGNRPRRMRYGIDYDDDWKGEMLNHGPSIVWMCEALPLGLNQQIDAILRLNRKTKAGRSILTNALCAGGLTVSDGESASLQQLGHLLGPADLTRAAARVALQKENCETETKLKLELSRLAKVRGVPLPDNDLAMDLDAALVSVEGFDFEALLTALARPEGGLTPTLLFSGPPGSGKSVAAHLVAQRMRRPVLLKRVSELLNMYVGMTEKKIAASFLEAREIGAVLVLDEADSLLFPRQDAVRSWEVSATNTMLVELEARRVPVVCTTNLFERLDLAALRRFDVKLTFGFLRPDQARMAFARFFGCVAPEGISTLKNLTPGDFRTVKARADLLNIRDPDELLRLLRNECEIKPGYESGRRIGFCA